MPHIGHESEELNYNDLQYQYVGQKRSYTSTNVNEAENYEYEPIQDRELDHNELAELVYMRRHLFIEMQVSGDAIDQTETGAVAANLTFEINSGTGEWLNSDQRDNAFSEENNRNLDLAEIQTQAPFNELETGGAGGGSSGTANDTREVMFAGPQGLFEHGPVLDANDTLNFRIETHKYNTTYNVRTKVYYVLGWRVHEIEDARPEFGIPL